MLTFTSASAKLVPFKVSLGKTDDVLPPLGPFTGVGLKSLAVAIIHDTTRSPPKLTDWPGAPIVAPFVGNSVTALLEVTPLIPPSINIVGEPVVMAIYPPLPPPPGPSLSLPVINCSPP